MNSDAITHSFEDLLNHIERFGFDLKNRIIRAVEEKGLKVPDDVSMVGVDAVSEVTSVVNDEKETGRIAAERLLERIANPGLKPERILLKGKLVDRNTVRKIK